MAAIALQAVSKSFGRTAVIRNVDLEVRDGEFMVFVGPSGCGKSTLLRLVAGLEDLGGGHILFDGRNVDDRAPSERGIAMVFQSYALYPHMSVYDNLAFGLKLRHAGRQELDARVREAARILQIEHLLARKPRELSGGQRQRVAIGRAIVRQPQVFLFDEPLSNLDAALRVQMRIEIAGLHRRLGTTMIYVTHDQIEAMTLADRIAVLNNGAVEQVGAPLELYHHPCNRFVAGFIGSPTINFLDARVGECAGEHAVLELDVGGRVEARLGRAGAVTAGQRVTLGLRPEHLAAGGPAGIGGSVMAVENLGGEAYVYLALAAGPPLVVKADGSLTTRVGQTMTVGVPAQACYLFDEQGRALPRAG